MWPFADRARTERAAPPPAFDDAPIRRELDTLREGYRVLAEKVRELEGEEFALTELRRQARNAVRSLERAAANAQDAPGRTNGKGARVEDPTPPPLMPPGPRRNY